MCRSTHSQPRYQIEVGHYQRISATLPLGKQTTVSIKEEAGWAPELVWMLWQENQTKFLGCLACSLVITPAILYWLVW